MNVVINNENVARSKEAGTKNSWHACWLSQASRASTRFLREDCVYHFFPITLIKLRFAQIFCLVHWILINVFRFNNHLQKADPTQFMQIHGRRCKIHLDPAIAAAGESPAIMQVIFQSYWEHGIAAIWFFLFFPFVLLLFPIIEIRN